MFDKVVFTGKLLDQYVANLPAKKYDYISPSSLGGCLRSHFYHIKGLSATTPPNYGALVNFEVGRYWEAFLAEKVFGEQGRLVKWFKDGIDAPWVNEKLGYGGTPDIIALDSEGEAIIVDSKTVRSEWFQYVKRDLLRPDGFKKWVKDNQAYIYQQVCYMMLARDNGYPKMRQAVLSFASKNDSYVGMELGITLTTELVKLVEDRIKLLRGYLDRDELPPCECEGWKVGYCDYGDPHTRTTNKKGKVINTTCCDEKLWEQYKGGKNE